MDITFNRIAINVGYKYEECNGVGYYTVPSFNSYGLINSFSTRQGGVSDPPFDSLNLSLSRPDSYTEESIQNYGIFAKALNISTNQMVVVNYCHGDGIQIVTERDCGNGLLFPNKLPPCDALITDRKNVALTTIHADCSSYLIFDKKNQVIAACHAGWKGTLLRIGTKTIKKMSDEYGTKAEDCIVGIGPNISYNRFEVDYPVAEMFVREYPDLTDAVRFRPSDNKYLIDLTRCAIRQFVDIGVNTCDITVSGLCTFEDNRHFFSFRRDGHKAGAMVSILMMK
ncbi:MAG: peptidoglycan editing factor PgeF [Clostridia bacterium]|nr:peptidoglycan editing factor PgeF [Clostridia bacterium]